MLWPVEAWCGMGWDGQLGQGEARTMDGVTAKETGVPRERVPGERDENKSQEVGAQVEGGNLSLMVEVDFGVCGVE